MVTDDGETYTGLAAIKKWKDETSSKYTYTSELMGTKEADGKTVVTSRLTGNFPGSPLDLQFAFGLEGDKIATLDIGL